MLFEEDLLRNEHRISSMDKQPKLFSRNTRVENVHDRAMMVEVRQTSPDVLVMTVEIPPGEHEYICHEDIPGPAGGRPGYVIVYIEGAREMSKKYIHPIDIMANEKLELNYSSEGGFTITLTRGNFIRRLGFIIRLKRVAQQIKSLGK
ncbi:uncharacterized protein LOC132166105 [Corylus avellana]|uniref:uncharacterized protein LOC132166105 n=1 Tax=Corylus avellana TaxID=13451 RepID=UPI00286CDED2|nr:uncharacterized protein LOC132166105 [Corylus avellana]XP_059432848.1 uncharacterized protein LOC132166105 [Corylus avellana]